MCVSVIFDTCVEQHLSVSVGGLHCLCSNCEEGICQAHEGACFVQVRALFTHLPPSTSTHLPTSHNLFYLQTKYVIHYIILCNMVTSRTVDTFHYNHVYVWTYSTCIYRFSTSLVCGIRAPARERVRGHGGRF